MFCTFPLSRHEKSFSKGNINLSIIRFSFNVSWDLLENVHIRRMVMRSLRYCVSIRTLNFFVVKRRRTWNNDEILLLHFRSNFSKDEKWNVFWFPIKDDVSNTMDTDFWKRILILILHLRHPQLGVLALLINWFSLTYCAAVNINATKLFLEFFSSCSSQFISFLSHFVKKKKTN